MATGPKVLYEFGPFRVDPDKQVLLRENQLVAITPKAFETLLILVRHSREVVSKEDLMKALWPDAFVEEANLSQNIFMLRKALGDTTEDRRYIVTLPGRGYRFAVQVRTVMQDGEDLVIESHSRSKMIVEQSESTPSETLQALPASVQRKAGWKYLLAIGASLVLLAFATAFFLRRHQQILLGATDSVVIADFANTTGDPVFDGTLRQGLAVQLEQSPFLSLVSEERIQHTLRLMSQAPEARLTPEVARQICERTASSAVLEGSIASLGSQYVLGLRATNCRTGDILDQEQVQAARKEDVLSALSQIATRFRTRIGESLATLEKHDTPLAEATTSSLEALKAYSAALKVMSSTGSAAALPLFKRAIEIDPQFAMGHAWVGRMYGDIDESDLSAESTGRAWQLRDRASDREKFWITAAFYTQVTENLEKAQQTCEVWAQTYPRDASPHDILSGIIYPVIGKYEQGVEEAKKAIELDPDFAMSYYLLASNYESLDRLGEAENTLQRASDRKLQIPDFLILRYDIAFLRDHKAEMEREAALGEGKSGVEVWIANKEAFALAYSGHLQEARRMSRRAVELAQQSGQRERAALWEIGAAVREAFFGNAPEARRSTIAALALSKDREVEYGAAIALALSGDSSQSQTLAKDLERRFLEDASVRFSYMPVLRALLAVKRREPAMAVELLQVAVPHELGAPRSSIHGFFGALYPVFVRGEAFLAAHQGAEAVAEYQKILDHRGIVVSDPVGALVHLELGRAYALSSDKAKARAAYQQFLAFWEDADPDIPILKHAKAEYAKLQ